MARINIYDSWITENSALETRTTGLSNNANAPRRSEPVRLFGGSGEVEALSYEFLWDFTALVQSVVLIWWQEFWGDKASLSSPPSARSWRGIDPTLGWAQEVDAIVGAAGRVDHYAVRRHVTVTPQSIVTPFYNSLWFPLSIHAPWVRVAHYVDQVDPETTVGEELLLAGNLRLRIFAHLGAHDEMKYLEENGHLPYAYNAFK